MSNSQYLADDMPFAVEPRRKEAAEVNKGMLRKQVMQDYDLEKENVNPYAKGTPAHDMFNKLFGEKK